MILTAGRRCVGDSYRTRQRWIQDWVTLAQRHARDPTVIGAELAALLGEWGACAGCESGLNGDGAVNRADIAVILGARGPFP